MNKALWVSAALLAGLAFVPAADAQTYSCGDIQLIFRNPDLQPGSDGFIRASGQLFVQFQAIGAEADRIATFGFSFGPYTAPVDESACNLPVWVTGTYLPNYRADRDPSDGFFIPLKTPLVPDGAYAAAVHAYDANNNELARFWARAVVNNCDGGDGTRCDGDAAQHARHDTTMPWPIILPGDGAKPADHQLTVEFAEPLSGLVVELNGQNITAELEPWDGRLWDADLVPDYGPGGAAAAVSPPCTQPYHTCAHYGPAFTWNRRALTDDDVVRVVATDVAGNVPIKTIHLGSTVAGGIVTQSAPILTYTVDTTRATVAAGTMASFTFSITNTGGGAGHPYASATGPAGWDLRWEPAHVVVDPGRTQSQDLTVTVPAGARVGTYHLNATLTYEQNGVERHLVQPLTVVVAEGAAAGGEEAPPVVAKGKGSPGPGAVLAALAVVAAALVLRRRA